MARQINPFVFGKPVPHEYFIGRDGIIDNCYNRLAGPVRTSVAISGEHGIGKTSLLHYLMFIAREEEWGQPYTKNIFIYVDCQSVKQFTPTRFWRHVLELLDDAEDTPALHQEIEPLLEQLDLDATHLQRLLRWLSQNQFSLVLLLDSFTWIVRANTDDLTTISDFLAGLRALTNLPDYALTLITATREPLNILCADIVKDYPGSYFYNNFAFEALPPFSGTEIDSLLEQAADRTGFEFDQADRHLLQQMAGAHPALLQIAGFHLFEARRRGSLSDGVHKKMIEDFERAARNYFSLFWNESTPLERTLFILVILLTLSKQTSNRLDMTGAEIQRLLQKHERNLMQLVERGLVEHTRHSYTIFSSIFIWWIVREVDAEDETELANRHNTIVEEPLRRAWQTLKKVAPQLTLDRLTQMLIRRHQELTMGQSTSQPPEPQEKQTEPSPSQPKEAPLSPSVRYELLEEVGRGASGIVYKAYDNRLARTVAIKLLHSALTPTIDSNHNLLKEARASSNLQHPHIVTIYDVTEMDGQICLVMEYLKGQTLADLLQEKQCLPFKQVIAVLDQAAQALDYAHSQNVIHRDIKPGNLVIASGRVKLTDFGIAKILGATQTNPSTGLKGTVIYMSPEQVNEQPLDGRSDLFSLAIVAFEMLSGSIPWSGTTYLELMTSITTDAPHSLADCGIKGAAVLEPIFQKALAKDPAARYQTGQDFVQALKNTVK
jgi:tRNA A-37 threonylcarbamoyl transferase component Bud32/archaellum biogenesis ATPase FlaH